MRKAYRVKKEQEFQKVFRRGKSCANRKFVVYVLEREEKHFRVGLSVGKKIGNAVTRNAVKRQLRASLQLLQDDIRSDVDFIVIARPGVEKLSSKDVYTNLQHVLKLAKVINESEESIS